MQTPFQDATNLNGKNTINGVSRFMKAATRSINSEVACAA